MVLVVGATEQLGGLIARRLLEREADVRVLVRPSSAYQPLVDAGARPVFGDLKDRASVAAAVPGRGRIRPAMDDAARHPVP